jgi:RNA polymerase sigma factor (sigma-70 family)
MAKTETSATEDPPIPGEPDAVVIERSRTEPECFATIFDRYAPRLHRYAARRQGEEGADDIVAETFLAAFRQRDGYDLTRSSAAPWLFAIATNLMRKSRRTEVSRYRAFARTGAIPEDDVANVVVDQVAAGAHRRPLAAALAGLHRRDRDVLLLIAWGDLSYEEVAEALSIPTGTVRSRLSRARRKVREALAETDVKESLDG